jgi:hypothetical protein
MADSFQARLDLFCSDFAVLGHVLPKGDVPSLEFVGHCLPRGSDDDDDEAFVLRCAAMVRTFAYLSDHWAAFRNLGFIGERDGEAWTIEGPLLYALCLYLAGEAAAAENPPDLEVVIDAALQGPQ